MSADRSTKKHAAPIEQIKPPAPHFRLWLCSLGAWLAWIGFLAYIAARR